ncbi:MAG: AraC family transcriptional regulator [Methylacidiphilales bacterium]|nr:AraC family transcriptional regulator [Candidatus Methylacidiphilales bacterium]
MGKPVTSSPPHPSFIARQIQGYRYFFLNLDPSPKSELTVACGGWEQCASDYRIDRADFEFFGMEYVARGKGVLILNGTEHKLVPGSVFAYKPFTAHVIETNPEDPLVKYFIDFSGRDAQRIINRKVLGAHGFAYLHHVQPIHDLYEQALESGIKGGPLAPRLCSLLLELLSLRIEENAHTPLEAHNRARQSFERCRAELQKHFCTIQSVAELAGMSHFDPAYLSRLFYRFAGESPHAMLMRLKMNEAAAHLIGGHFTVKEVAARVGFSDPYHFSRVFKKHHGIPPVRFQESRTRQ